VIGYMILLSILSNIVSFHVTLAAGQAYLPVVNTGILNSKRNCPTHTPFTKIDVTACRTVTLRLNGDHVRLADFVKFPAEGAFDDNLPIPDNHFPIYLSRINRAKNKFRRVELGLAPHMTRSLRKEAVARIQQMVATQMSHCI
jgi:hypothetical protein